MPCFFFHSPSTQSQAQQTPFYARPRCAAEGMPSIIYGVLIAACAILVLASSTAIAQEPTFGVETSLQSTDRQYQDLRIADITARFFCELYSTLLDSIDLDAQPGDVMVAPGLTLWSFLLYRLTCDNFLADCQEDKAWFGGLCYRYNEKCGAVIGRQEQRCD